MIKIYKFPKRTQWREYFSRPVFNENSTSEKINEVFNVVEKYGDEGVKKIALEFDEYKSDSLKVPLESIRNSSELVDLNVQNAIKLAQGNIQKFHESQISKTQIVETQKGVKCWRETRPINNVGLYIPGGLAPLFSTLLMLAIPAKIAGVKNIFVSTPPNKQGGVDPEILYVAKLLGINEIFSVGGIQAIAAYALGTETIPSVDKIFGPGNQFVTSAKAYAQKKGVAIDMLAGPSELFVVADNTANPQFVAADLVSQAEHGTDSQVILASNSETLLRKVNDICVDLIKTLPREKIAKKSLSKSRLVLMSSIENCIELSNFYAPEHLIIACNKARTLRSKISNAGSVFLGNFSCESAGDYASGTNHALPTGGTAVAQSGVSVESFQKKISFQTVSKEGLENIGPSIKAMANAEGLQAHALAVDVRLENKS